MKKPQIQTIIITLLAVGLICTICYIAFDKYNTAQKEAQDVAFQDGLEQGYGLAVLEIAQKASTGQQISLPLGNQTIYIISVDTCLQIQNQ